MSRHLGRFIAAANFNRHRALVSVQCPDMTASIRSRRIDVRVTDEQDAVIREAAAASGQTVSAFLLSAAERSARVLLDERRHLVMSDRAFAAFAAVLDAPGDHVPALNELLSLPRISSE